METEKKKLLLALLVSFAVAVVGAVVWGFVYHFGIYASIVSYISAFAMYKVYLIFNKSNKFTFIWIVGISIILNMIACVIAIAIEYPNYNVFEFIQNYKMTFGLQMLLSILFTFSGASAVYKQKQKKERQNTVLTQNDIEKIKQELKDEYAKEKKLEENQVSEEVIQELKNDMKNIESETQQSTQTVNDQTTSEDKKDN